MQLCAIFLLLLLLVLRFSAHILSCHLFHSLKKKKKLYQCTVKNEIQYATFLYNEIKRDINEMTEENKNMHSKRKTGYSVHIVQKRN